MMVRIRFVAADGGSVQEVQTQEGVSLMQVATAHELPGIDAICGGNCACGTCHVVVAQEWASRIPVPDETELSMLEGLEVPPGSRLSCQIRICADLDGLTVQLPEVQI